MKKIAYLVIVLSIPVKGLVAQNTSDVESPSMDFENYNPTSTLVVPKNIITKAKFPFIDVHNHQWGLNEDKISNLVEEMNDLNMAVMVNLSGRGFNRETRDVGTQEYLADMVRTTEHMAKSRFIIFTNVSYRGVGEKDWAKNAVRQLEEDVANGANGLKVYKSLGLRNLDINGKRIAIDDPRLDPIWAKCGELGIPVLIHAADPKPFWDDHDDQNERWLELKLRPGRKRSDVDPAPWEQIIAEQHNIFRRHSNTKFINAHMGWYANNLDKLASLMDEFPNMYTEIGAVIAELGRQPRRAKAFLTKYQDRVMFGKDAYNKEQYYTYFRVLETADEYFPYYKKYHAYWKMYGLDLSDEVLKKLYYKNALNIIPNIDKSLFPK